MPPFRMHEVRELIRLIGESDIDQFELDNEGSKIVIKKGAVEKQGKVVSQAIPDEVKGSDLDEGLTPTIATPAVEQKKDTPVTGGREEGLHTIESPMVGTFYRAPSPEDEVFVQQGSTVDEKSVVCIIEAMKLMNEIESEVKGIIKEILVENGELVEYGQPLFLVKST